MAMESERTFLSVIVPVRNTGKYLPRCLDALTAQTFSQMEIIIVDDASSEDIQSVASPYNVRYERLNDWSGPGGARNYGLSLAEGKYVSFCDSDDWVDLDYYNSCVELMEQRQADIAMCTLLRSYDDPMQPLRYKCRYDKVMPLTGDMAIKILTKQYDMGILVIPSSVNKVYRRSHLDKYGLRFVEKTLFEDLLFSFQAIVNAEKVICVPHVRYHHYRRPDSIVQSFSQKHIDDFVTIFSMLREYLQNTGNYERYRFNYYKFCEQFYNLIVRQIFEFVQSEEDKKAYISYSFRQIKALLDFDEYMEYTTAEQIRRHIQPHIDDTTLY